MEDNKEQQLHAVLYTDGSADNIKKIYGFGAHGYIFDANNKSEKTSNKPQNYIVTDKGYKEPNEMILMSLEEMTEYYDGEYSVDELKKMKKYKNYSIVDPIEYIDIYGSNTEPGTNNVGEVLAVLESVNALKKMGVVDILIYTDSTYTQGVIKNSLSKSVEDIRTTVNANTELWVDAKFMHEELGEKNIELQLDKIKAHAGHLGNETADDLALLGRFESTRGTTHIDVLSSSPKNYWKPKYERHTFLNTKQIFFEPGEKPRPDNSMEYYVLSYKNENEIGKRSHTAGYGYIVLKDKDPYIEEIKQIFTSELGSHSVPATVRMDNLFKPDIFKYVYRYGIKAMNMIINRNKMQLEVLENDVIANAVNPPALAYKAMDDMNLLRMITEDYNKWKADPNSHKTHKEFIEITDMFYTYDAKDKLIIKPELTNDVKHLDYEYKKDGKKGKIVIQLGTDIITRNQIKKLEKLEPRIYLVVINNRNIKLNYFTLIDLEATGDTSVWSNYYSNTVMLK